MVRVEVRFRSGRDEVLQIPEELIEKDRREDSISDLVHDAVHEKIIATGRLSGEDGFTWKEV